MNLKEASEYLAGQLSERIMEPKKIATLVASTLDILIQDSNLHTLKKQVYNLLEKTERQAGVINELKAKDTILKNRLRSIIGEEQMKDVYKELKEAEKLRYEPRRAN